MKAIPFLPSGFSVRWLGFGTLAIALVFGWAFSGTWLPPVQRMVGNADKAVEETEDVHAEHEHDHSHEGHDEESSLELTEQTRGNLGLKVGEVSLQAYDRSLAIPSIVVEQPGQTTIRVAAPVTGVITGVYALPGEAISDGQPLFTVRLTHEGVVQSQTDFLQVLGQLDVENREIARLEQIEPGAIAPRIILERKYAKSKLEAELNADREALQLYGLNLEQIAVIERDRKLLREVEVSAPELHSDSTLHDVAEGAGSHAGTEQTVSHAAEVSSRATLDHFVVTELNVKKGEIVQAGSPMATVGDYSELYLEGRAFQQDAEQLVAAANAERNVTAVVETQGGAGETVEGLRFSHVSNAVDPESRALHFYVRLPNEIVHDAVREDGRHFPTWRFKVGQRMQVRVPVDRWENVFALPVDAIAQEGPQTFVFVQNGDHFHRRPVHVIFSDQLYAVIANDGSIFPGDSVALNSAHQMLMAIKNKAGGGVDPHAGHNH